MPSSAVRTFLDPDDYAAFIRNSTAEMTITGRGVFNAKLTRIDLHRLWMQRFSDNLPRIAHGADMRRPSVMFRTRPGPNLLWGGVEMRPTHIIRHAESESAFQHSSGLADWAAMSLPIEDMVPVGAAIGDLDLTPPKNPTLVASSPAAMTRLQQLHAAAGDLAEKSPEIIANPEAARGLEQALIEALVGCLADRADRQNSLAQGQHAIVMRRFRRVVEENSEEPLYIPDICKAIRVSPRALLLCCQEHLEMRPKRYLLLRRMQLVRRALRQATPGTTSVTEIAMRHGFWQLGRFAVKYRSLFGESPSATLHRQPV